MKNPNLARLLAFLLCTTIFSCSKNGDTPKPPDPPVTHSDTLSAGWSKQILTTNPLTDVFFLNSTTGYTSHASVYKTIDGGISWDSVSSTAGYNLAVTPNGNVFTVNTVASVFKSVDGGQTFEASQPLANVISDVYFTDNDTGYAISLRGNFYKTVNQGKNWMPVSSLAGTANGYASLHFFDSKNGWATIGNSVYKINADGISWTKSIITGGSNPNGGSNVFASSYSEVYYSAPNGEIYKSTDGGLNFSLLKKLTGGGGYLDLDFINTELGYACYGNRIYKTSDGGNNWQVVVALGNEDFSELHFTDTNHGWACTRMGSILRFTE